MKLATGEWKQGQVLAISNVRALRPSSSIVAPLPMATCHEDRPRKTQTPRRSSQLGPFGQGQISKAQCIYTATRVTWGGLKQGRSNRGAPWPGVGWESCTAIAPWLCTFRLSPVQSKIRADSRWPTVKRHISHAWCNYAAQPAAALGQRRCKIPCFTAQGLGSVWGADGSEAAVRRQPGAWGQLATHTKATLERAAAWESQASASRARPTARSRRVPGETGQHLSFMHEWLLVGKLWAVS